MGRSSGRFAVRTGQSVVAAVMAGALMFAGAGVALGEDAPATDAAPDATAQSGTTSLVVPDETKQKSDSDAGQSSTQTQQQPAAPEQKSDDGGQPQQTTSEPGQKPTDQSVQKPSMPEQKSTESTSQQKPLTDAPAPALRWNLVDGNGDRVSGATVTLQGPRSDTVADNGHDEQWADTAEATVEDNTGQSDYVGADLDPAPGAFQIEKFADGDSGAEAVAVVPGSEYRVRPAEADGFATGDATDWAELPVLTDPAQKTTDVVLAPLPAKKSAVAAPLDAVVAPMVVGPEPTATKPYLYWEVRDQSSNALRGGASFELEGPRTSDSWFLGEYNVSWNERITVQDCISAPCTGADQDPDPGEFLVTQIGSHRVSDSNRYRVRQLTAPSGYLFTTSGNSWVEIPGTRNTPSGWNAGIFDYGDFQVKAIPPMGPVCTPGQIYGVTEGGQLRAISPSGTVTNLGTAASGVDAFNDLGIGSGGSLVYAVERSSTSGTSQNATVWQYNTTTGTWASTGYSTSSLGGNTGTNMVGGAVDLKTGLFYFGGFTSSGDFKVYEYNPSGSPRIKLKGTIVTASTSSANGDIAFNANGDLFVVHGNGNQTTVYSVTAANLAAATGGNITSSQSATVETLNNVNGVAFDSSGRAYLGTGSELRSYAMPNWSDEKKVVTSGLGTSDLASCSSPATVTIQKFVQGGRVNPNDQFNLTLSQGTTVLGTALTQGNTSGLQTQQIGPQPTARGVTLSFKETASGSTTLSNYVSSWTCTVDGDAYTSGQGTSGTVQIPATGDVIVCRITNAPLVASVSISKTVLDTNGENGQPGAGWTVGAAPSLGTIVSTPAASTQSTNAQGNASWSLKFSSASDKTNVSVSEVQKTGYEFVEGQCLIQSLDGSITPVDLHSAAAQSLTNIKPGDQVQCSYANKQIPGSISWQKVTDDSPAANIGGSTFTVKGPGATGPTVTVSDCVGANAAACAASADKDERAGYLKVTGLAWGTYTIVETVAPTGFTLDSTPRTVTITAANAQAGATMTAVVNARITGSVTWTKTATDKTTLLGGSVWKLAGPGLASGGVTVEDCIQASAANCTGPDKDPAAGKFRVDGLRWGDFTLTETSAPLGYVLDTTPHTFTISGTVLTVALGAFVNELGTPPTLPLTGGISRDFYSLLGLGVLLMAFALLVVRRVWLRRQASALGGAMTD